MRIVCSGRSRRWFKNLYQKICGDKDSFLFFGSALALLHKLISETVRADVLLLDYDLYHGFAGLFFEMLRSGDLEIPILLVGHGRTSDRVQGWLCENELHYDTQTMHRVIPLLQKINEALESGGMDDLFLSADGDEMRACSFERARLQASPQKMNPIEQLRRKTDLPPSSYNLLKFMYKNRRREISIEEIETHIQIEGGSDAARKNTAYSYISRLRKCIEKSPRCEMEIIRTRKGFYRLFLR